MCTKLVEVTRGDIVESCHYGHIAVTDTKGNLIAHAGDPEAVTYMRSAAKPLLALDVILSGAADRYGFTAEELSIFCSSHYGEEMHCRVIDGILKKLGLTRDVLLCGSPYSMDPAVRTKQLLDHLTPTTANSPCSGKHCGFLSVCQMKGYDLKTYVDPDSVLQQELLKIVSDFCDVPMNDIHIGYDGCDAPVHGMPIRNMAISYARLANPDCMGEPYADACRKIYDAANEAPLMLAGTNGFCSEFLAATNGKFFGKLGAESLYMIGVKDKDLGIAVKIGDGNYRALYPAVMSTLRQLDLLTPEEEAALARFSTIPIKNDLGRTVGMIRPAFELEFDR